MTTNQPQYTFKVFEKKYHFKQKQIFLQMDPLFNSFIEIYHRELANDCAEFVADPPLFSGLGKTPRMLSNISVGCPEKCLQMPNISCRKGWHVSEVS